MRARANTGLLVLNLVTAGLDGPRWFAWPLAAWGIGLVIHVAAAAVPVFSPDLG